MYLIIGALIGLLGFLVSLLITDMRNMKRLLRVQQDEVRRLEKRTHELQMLLGDVIAKGQIRDYEKMKMLKQMQKGGPSIGKLAEHQSRPGEKDQELLLR